MGDSKGGPSTIRNSVGSGKQAYLPPKSPIPTAPPSYVDYSSAHPIGSKVIAKPRESRSHHRASSVSCLIEEQPSWLDDLLNEPETPVRRGAQRRSSSDSFAYLDTSNFSLDSLVQEDYSYKHRNVRSQSSWGPGEFAYLRDAQHPHYYAELNSFGGLQNVGWQSAVNTAVSYPSSCHPSSKDKTVLPGLSCAVKEPALVTPNVAGKHDQEESAQDPRGSNEGFHGKHPQSEMDNKRARQQFAQRSRVRKLQYINELERNVQALQAEGMEFAAELEFLNQQNLVLDLENKAMKQRLGSLENEHLLKCVQHEVLEREIGRLRALFFHQQQQQQQQQQHHQPTPTHSRRNSRDLDSQFANLSLKHKEAKSGQDPVTGPLGI